MEARRSFVVPLGNTTLKPITFPVMRIPFFTTAQLLVNILLANYLTCLSLGFLTFKLQLIFHGVALRNMQSGCEHLL